MNKNIIDGVTALVIHGWCKGARAKDEAGNSVKPESPEAIEWDIKGAFEYITGKVTGGEELGFLSFIRKGKRLSNIKLNQWNDSQPDKWAVVNALREFAATI